MDGKTLRAARRMGAVAEKSNEIPCVRELLRSFRNVRLLVTIDAMHTQTTTARLICSTLKSHYVMVVKQNQPKLLAPIQALPWSQVPVVHTEPPQRSHSRTETRTLKVLTAVRGVGFPHARQVIHVIRERVSGSGEHSREVAYALCSLPFEHARPPLIAAWLRDHWGIENAVHWVRDVTFDEDRCTVRTGTAPQVLATLLAQHRTQPASPPRHRQHRRSLQAHRLQPDRGLELLNQHQISRSQAASQQRRTPGLPPKPSTLPEQRLDRRAIPG